MFNATNFNNRKGYKSQPRRERTLHLEALEERELLSVSPFDASDDVPAVVAPSMASEATDQEKPVVVADLGEAEQQRPDTTPAEASSGHYYYNGVCYNAHDVACLQNFFEQTNAAGIKNGFFPRYDYLSFEVEGWRECGNEEYRVNDPTSWLINWTEIDGEMRVTRIDLVDYNMAGEMNLSGCTALKELVLIGTYVSSLNISKCSNLYYAWCGENELTSLNAMGCTALTVLLCDDNPLKLLDLSGCSSLNVLDLNRWRQFSTLDVSLPKKRLDRILVSVEDCDNYSFMVKDTNNDQINIIDFYNDGDFDLTGVGFCIETSASLPIYVSFASNRKIVFSESSELSIVKESIKFEDKETRKTYKDLGEKEEDIEDAFIGKEATIQVTLQMSESCDSTEDAIAQISKVTWRLDKINDDGTVVEGVDSVEVTNLQENATWDSSTHQLTITQDKWQPSDDAFGNISITCEVVPSEPDAESITETNAETEEGKKLRIGVTEYDVSFGRATVDSKTGGVKTIDGNDIEHSFDRNNSKVEYTDLKMSREEYDKHFINNHDKKEQWNWLVNYLVDKKRVSFEKNAYNASKNSISEEYAKKVKADQMKMLQSLLDEFSDYHFYILLGKETDREYETITVNNVEFIKNPESDIMRTIYVPSLADTTDYSASDANVEIMARVISYVNWTPGSLVIYSKWHQDSSTSQYQNIKGGGEIILTPYVVAFTKVTPGATLPSSNFQGYGLMNAEFSADSCNDNFFISRGTEKNLSDVLTDAMPSGVGYKQYLAAKQDVLNWIRNLQTNSVTLTGHSLGGALTQWFSYGCANQNIINRIKKITTFNAAGISKAAADEFNKYCGGISISHYVSNGDVVSFAGEAFIGKGNIVNLITYRLEYIQDNNKVDLLGRPVNDDGFIISKDKLGFSHVTGEYGSFESGYKHGMWLANEEWRNSFFNNYSSFSQILGFNKTQYKLLGKTIISVETLNSYWFHWTQTGYLFATNTQELPSFLLGDNGSKAFIRGTTEQLRQKMLSLNSLYFTGFDANNNKSQDRTEGNIEWWLDDIHACRLFFKNGFFNQMKYTVNEIKNKINQNDYKGLTITTGTTYAVAELSTLSGMKLPVVLSYIYSAERSAAKNEDCLLNGIYVKKAAAGTKFGKIFSLADDVAFTFISDTYNVNMTNNSVRMRSDNLSLNSICGRVSGTDYIERTSNSTLNINSLTLNCNGRGHVASIVANAAGKQMTFNFSKSTATAHANLTITLNSQSNQNTQDVILLTDAKVSYEKNTIIISFDNNSSGTFNGQAIQGAKLEYSAGTWKISSLISNNKEYKFINGKWILPEQKENKDKSSNFGFQNASAPAALPTASLAPTLMTPAAADSETRALAFSWTVSVENPNLLFQVGNTVYTESEMIANGDLLLYVESSTYRSYIVRDASADVNSWRYDSDEELGSVQVALQTFSGDITPALVTSVNAAISNNSVVTVDFTVENMSTDSLIQIAVCQAGQTEDVLNFYVPVSEMMQTSDGYSYAFDLAEFELPTGDYQIYAWSDESMRENAAVSASYQAVIESELKLSQVAFSFDDTNAMQGSAVKQLTISNTGNAKSHVAFSLANAEEITGVDFTISGLYSNGNEIYLDCIELAPGESVTLDIQFTPQSEGDKLWNIELLDLNSTETRGEFTLSGAALPLRPTDVSIEADESSLSERRIAPGDPLYASGTLKNTGDNYSDSITISLYASENADDLRSGILLDSYEGIVLEGQSETTIPFYIYSTGDLPEGDWHLGFVIDCDNDEFASNNVCAFSDCIKVLPTSSDSVLQNFSESLNDQDNNGSFDTLGVSGEFNAETAGNYTIVWSLRDSESQEISNVSQDYSLSPGTNTVTVDFDGVDISSRGVDGPYSVSAKVISDQCVWYNQDVFVTSAYNANQFERGRLASPYISVFPMDSNSAYVIVDSVPYASEYTLEYSTDPEFSNVATKSVSAGYTAIGELADDSKYYFRVKANETDVFDNSDYSSVQTVLIGDVLLAQDDFVKTTFNRPATINYRANDDASDWSATTIQFGEASHGECVVNADGTITYTPEIGFFGTDTIGYDLISPLGKISTGSISINVGLPIAASVQKTSSSHVPSTVMAASVDSLTDWDNCCIELWAQGVTELDAGEATITLEYNPAVYAAAVLSDCADGVALSVSQGVLLPNGNVQVELTVEMSQTIASQTDHLYLGTVVLTPSLEDDAGVEDGTSAPACVLDGLELTTTVETKPYDLVRNGAVDVNDFIAFATVFGTKLGTMSPDNPFYVQTVKADFNNDGIINVDDFIIFAINFGATKTSSAKPIPQASAAADSVRCEEFDNSEFVMQNAELIESQVEPSELELAVPVSQPAPPVSQLEVEPSMTLREAHSAALLDLYDNFDRAVDLSDVSNSLAESRRDVPVADYSDGDSLQTLNCAIDVVLEKELLAIDWN